MQFQNPWGALAFLFLVPLLLLYLLKQRYQERQVPSIALWNQVLTQWEASHPWQKWRRNLLFFLQALAICLLALALMRPVWRTTGTGQNNIIVLDLSMSMQAREDGRTRLDLAKEGVENLMGQMQRDEEVSILLSGQQNEPLVTRSQDKKAVLQLVQQVQAWNGSNRLEEALQLAEAMVSSNGQEVIHVFTDREIAIPNAKTVIHNVAQGSENVAISSVSYSLDSSNQSITVLGLLQNFGGAKTVNVELWGDGALLDIRECSLDSNSAGNVLFDGLDSQLRFITLALSEEDALEADNRAFCVVQDSGKYKVLLQTQRNVFLEKAILLRDDIELYKTTPSGQLPHEHYGLIIGDGWEGRELPEDGNLWILSPQESTSWFDLYTTQEMGIRVANTGRPEPLLRHVDLSELRLAKAKALPPQDSATQVLAYLDEKPLIIQQETDTVKRLAFGFDIHESNLPLQKDFPILVQNILEWFLPRKEGQSAQVMVGSPVTISMQSSAQSYQVGLPDGTQREDRTQPQFTETQEPGFYTVTQWDASGNCVSESAFAVNAPLEESELRTSPTAATGEAQQSSDMWHLWNLLPYLIMLALVLMALEWWVYHRGN